MDNLLLGSNYNIFPIKSKHNGLTFEPKNYCLFNFLRVVNNWIAVWFNFPEICFIYAWEGDPVQAITF